MRDDQNRQRDRPRGLAVDVEFYAVNPLPVEHDVSKRYNSSLEPVLTFKQRLRRVDWNPTSTRLVGARQRANAPTLCLQPFNQARLGPLGICQEKRQQGLRDAT